MSAPVRPVVRELSEIVIRHQHFEWFHYLAVSTFFLFVQDASFGQRDVQNIPVPDPELERQTFILPEGFEVNLFAADPELAKPIQMNFDPQGRLWVCTSETYPQIAPGEQANDKILILHDTNGDGTSDKTTVFADGLLIPTGIAPGDGGAYVGASTELLHLKDTTGDGRADQRRIVYSGFGTEDTHHILHTFRWGPEGRLYFSQSIYIHSHIETPWGPRRLNAGGFWRFRPETLELEVFARGLINSWGTDFDRYGTTFATDGAGGEGINYLVPGASYATARGADRILRGLNPGSPKHCGLEIVESEHLPDDWQGSLITNDFRGHRVCRFVLTEDGAGFRSQEQQEVIKSNHVAFRPVDVKLGPDGAIYVADWYNPIIQHGEVDFRDPRRDRVHGRIWRVTYRGQEKGVRGQGDEGRVSVDFTGLSTGELFDHLKSPNKYDREQTRQVLRERGQGSGVRDELADWLAELADDVAFDRWRLEALWVMQSWDTVDPGLLERCLNSEDHGVRAAAMRIVGDELATAQAPWRTASVGRVSNPSVTKSERPSSRPQPPETDPTLRDKIPNDTSPTPSDKSVPQHASLGIGDVSFVIRDGLETGPVELLAWLERGVHDSHPRVRLEAVRALAKGAKPQAAAIAMRALEYDVDQWLDYSLWLTARELQPYWEPALLAGELDFEDRIGELTFLLKSAGSTAGAGMLVELIRSDGITADALSDVLEVIQEFGTPEHLGLLFELALTAEKDTSLRADILTCLHAASRTRGARPNRDLAEIASLLESTDARLWSATVRCIGEWKLAAIRDRIGTEVANEARSEAERVAAVRALGTFADDSAGAALIEISRTSESASLQRTAIEQLLALRPEQASEMAAAHLQALDRADSAGALFREFLSRQRGADLLAEALRDRELPRDVAVMGMRIVSSSGQGDSKLAEALRRAGSLEPEAVRLTEAEMAELLREVREQGDPARGEAVFRRTELACFKCHAIGPAGGEIGPNLLSLGASSQLDYIVESLLDPDAKIKEGFETLVVATDAGQVHSGLRIRQSDTELVLRDADGRDRRIRIDEIEAQRQGASLMPAGLLAQITRQELLDLSAFLSALGREPDYTIGTQPVVRHWEFLLPTQEAAFQLRRTSDAVATGAHPAFGWQRIYSRVNGALPLEDLPEVQVRHRVAEGDRGISFVRTKFSVSRAGRIDFEVNNPTGLQIWVNDVPLDAGRRISFEVPRGEHRLTLTIDRTDRDAPLFIRPATTDDESGLQLPTGP